MEQVKILLVEDDARFGALQRDFLTQNGFDVLWLQNGLSIKEEVSRFQPELIVLDIMLPGASGLDICREIRHIYPGRILFLTSSSDDYDQVACLELGADDFVSKTVQPRVLLARVRMLLRRQATNETAARPSNELQYGKLLLRNKPHETILDGTRIDLTDSEFSLLWLLAENADKAMTRNELFKELRGFEFDGMDRSIDAKIVSLRKKLFDSGSGPIRIATVRNKGYLFVSDAWE